MFQRLNGLEAARVGAEELTPEEVPFLCFDAAGQERFDGWRADLEQRLRPRTTIRCCCRTWRSTAR